MNSMAALADRKCLNHGGREAVARCPRCRSHFCRECVSEHGGRILCAPCLAAETATAAPAGASRAWLPFAAAIGLAFAWLCFLGLGKALLAVPASVHDGGWAGTVSGAGRDAAEASP